jgi:signal peptidase
MPAHSLVRRWAGRLGVALGILALGLAALMSAGPRVLPFRAFTVLSGSMRPALPVGSLVIATPVQGDEVEVGDIVTFVKPGGSGELVTHRVVEVTGGPGGRVLTTQGDANGAPDAWEVPANGSGWRVLLDVPKVGYVLGGGASKARSLVFGGIVAVLALWLLIEVWRPEEQADRQPDRQPGLQPAM